jgi:hypothetical protein
MRSVSWLAGRRSCSAFPDFRPVALEARATAYSCGGSYGFGSKRDHHRIPMFVAAFAAQNTNISLHLNAGRACESILRKTRKRLGANIGGMKQAKTKAAGEVAAVFGAYPPKLRARLVALRRLILRTGAKTAGVGVIYETLKWGQPSYLTPESKSGSTIRIDRVKRSDEKYAVYFHCQTDLVPTFRELYPNKFRYEGNRAILLDANKKPDEKALAHCIALALTYHARKSKKRK